MLENSVTYIADRGYMSFQLFYDIQKAGSFFVFRVKNNLVFSVIKPLHIHQTKTIQQIFSQVTDDGTGPSNGIASLRQRKGKGEKGK